MKKIFFFLLASIIFCVSCTRSLLIPKQSTVIAVFDAPSLVKKAQLKDIDALKNETKLNELPVLRELVQNPANTGIDSTSDMFIFHTVHNEKNYICANISLKNQKQTQEFVETMLGKIFQAEGKHRFYAERNNAWIIIKNNTMLVVASPDSRNKINSEEFVNYLATLPKKASITHNEHFRKFLKNKNDIGIFVSSTPILENLKPRTRTYFSGLLAIYKGLNEADLYDNYCIANVDFKNNEVEIDYSYVFNKQFENYVRENSLSKEHVSNELLQFAHETSMVITYYSFNVEKALTYLQDIPKFSDINEEFSEKTGVSLDTALSLFAGDFLVSLYDIEEYKHTPLFAIVASITDESKVNELLQSQFADFKKDAAIPYYDFSSEGLFVAVHNNIIMATSDSTALTALVNGGFNNILTNSAFTSTDYDTNLFVNLDFDTYPDRVQELFDGMISLKKLPFKSLMISGENSSMSAKMVLTMKNDNGNSLWQILQFFTSSASPNPSEGGE